MLTWIPGGDPGTWATLRVMRRLVRQSLADRLTIETAHAIVKACPPRDVRCEALSLRAWLGRSFRFVRDPAEQETLRPPPVMLAQLQRDGIISGDCDDAATLGAALGAAIGFEPFAVVVAFRGAGSYRHVYTLLPLAPISSEVIDLDVTRPVGMAPIPATRSMVWKL